MPEWFLQLLEQSRQQVEANKNKKVQIGVAPPKLSVPGTNNSTTDVGQQLQQNLTIQEANQNAGQRAAYFKDRKLQQDMAESYSKRYISDRNKDTYMKTLKWQGLNSGLGQMSNVTDAGRNTTDFGTFVGRTPMDMGKGAATFLTARAIPTILQNVAKYTVPSTYFGQGTYNTVLGGSNTSLGGALADAALASNISATATTHAIQNPNIPNIVLAGVSDIPVFQVARKIPYARLNQKIDKANAIADMANWQSEQYSNLSELNFKKAKSLSKHVSDLTFVSPKVKTFNFEKMGVRNLRNYLNKHYPNEYAVSEDGHITYAGDVLKEEPFQFVKVYDPINNKSLSYNFKPFVTVNDGNVSIESSGLVYHPSYKFNSHADSELNQIISDRMKWAQQQLPGYVPSGSSLGVVEGGLTHVPHDLDGYMTASAFNKVRNKFYFTQGNHPDTFIWRNGNEELGEINVIDINKSGLGNARANQLYRQTFPELYRQQMINEANGQSFRIVDANGKVMSAEQLLDAYKTSATKNVIMDAIEIDPTDKPKHATRVFNYLLGADPKLMHEALESTYRMLFQGTGKMLPKLKFGSPEQTQQLLEKVGYPQDLARQLSTSPEKAQNALDYWYLADKSLMRSTNSSKMVNRVQEDGDANQLLINATTWNPQASGETASGAGLNMTIGGSSQHPRKYNVYIQPNLNIPEGTSAEDAVNTILKDRGELISPEAIQQFFQQSQLISTNNLYSQGVGSNGKNTEILASLPHKNKEIFNEALKYFGTSGFQGRGYGYGTFFGARDFNPNVDAVGIFAREGDNISSSRMHPFYIGSFKNRFDADKERILVTRLDVGEGKFVASNPAYYKYSDRAEQFDKLHNFYYNKYMRFNHLANNMKNSNGILNLGNWQLDFKNILKNATIFGGATGIVLPTGVAAYNSIKKNDESTRLWNLSLDKFGFNVTPDYQQFKSFIKENTKNTSEQEIYRLYKDIYGN